jgi:hypothetical protein
MTPLDWTMWAGGAAACVGGAVLGRRVWQAVRARGLDRWVPRAIWPAEFVPAIDWTQEPVDVFLAVCDHFEPDWGRPSATEALARATAWRNEYPRLFGGFRDVDGRPPQHTFFYPQDEYRPECMEQVAELCHAGFGEVEIHLHHDHDTAESLTAKLSSFRDELHSRFGLLRRDPVTGRLVYGFIHGNWALCNSRPDRRWCGVAHELRVLLATGCYADFTFPSAPSPTQPRIINSIYYARDSRSGRECHHRGERARVGQLASDNALLMIQGPLLFDFGRPKWGLIPRVENGDLLASHPPSLARVPLWVRAGVTVAGRPNWRFVKLHTHGCNPGNQEMWLGETVVRFHRDLEELHRHHANFRYHYVTAWELAELVHLAERSGTPSASAALAEIRAGRATGERGVRQDKTAAITPGL